MYPILRRTYIDEKIKQYVEKQKPKEDVKIFEGGEKIARHIKIFTVNELKEKNIAKHLEMVNKKAGIPD